MPSIGNITVKKADGSTDIVYTAISPSAGNGVPALWRSQTVGSAQSHQPELRLTAKDGGNGATRVVTATYHYPQIATDSTTSLVSVVQKATARLEITVPNGMAQTDADEFGAQLTNLLDSSLIVDCLQDRVAPT